MKHCEYDHNLDEKCGQPAVIKVRIGKHVMWMCAQHYDEHARLMAVMGRTPEGEEN